MGERVELECAHCGDLIQVPRVAGPITGTCPSCEEPFEVPASVETEDVAERKETNRFRRPIRRQA